MPAIDVFEREDKVIIKADLPGLKKEDIDVSLVNDQIIIRGQRKEETKERRKNYYRAERSYGSFSRTIRLPYPADPKDVEATYDEGVLEVTLPRSSESHAISVQVSTGENKNK